MVDKVIDRDAKFVGMANDGEVIDGRWAAGHLSGEKWRSGGGKKRGSESEVEVSPPPSEERGLHTRGSEWLGKENCHNSASSHLTS